MSQLLSHHFRRQSSVSEPSSDPNIDPTPPDYCGYWWYCNQTAYIVKWIVIGAIFFLVLLFMGVGYWHAKRRMARGLPPLRYHRWLVSRQARERFFPPPQRNTYGLSRPVYNPGGFGGAQTYPMHNYAYPAPPAYHESEAAPVYTPPSKVNPDQSYAPPPGSPPAFNSHAESSHLNVPGPSEPPRVASPYHNK